MTVSPFFGRQPQDVLKVVLPDGSSFQGSYLAQAGMHFLHVRDGSMAGRVEGPFDDAVAVSVVRPRAEVMEDRRERRLGDRVPGSLRRDRDGYEARLGRLANAAAREPDFSRRSQVEAQFDEVADEIELARTKRNWLLRVARWNLHSNEEPTKLGLSGGDMTMAERLQRPRPRDFDPDPKVRRSRPAPPAHALADPRSTRNMVRALRADGFDVGASVFGEVTHDAAELFVRMPMGAAVARWSVTGARVGAKMSWTAHWYGNGSGADLRRMRRASSLGLTARLEEVVARGLLSPGNAPAEADGDAGPPSPR